jgi:hypothetical protein
VSALALGIALLGLLDLLFTGIVVVEIVDAIGIASCGFPQSGRHQFRDGTRTGIDGGACEPYGSRRQDSVPGLCRAVAKGRQEQELGILRQVDDLAVKKELIVEFSPGHYESPTLFHPLDGTLM